ncbi:PREDICTED: uncharacterized protein LOC104598915 [Nelumbo nucifera]|uniref:Uncharacterized protein LOC104598915 n=1 Tax=Nelumbo nucifera TaxID=4432 RepID=A0A1U8A040_NELNU|nr:PREDICTED: uncharacterized protein LOC104598915 [Nelumbo nucifera]
MAWSFTPKHTSLTAFAACLIFVCSVSTHTAADHALTAYQVLQGYGFPVGILPKGILGYDLDTSTGKFSAYLNGTCAFSLEGSYKLRYKSTITGVISQNKLRNLKGVSVKVLFLWLDIIEVTRSGDKLDFSVGIASADFDIDNFVESPQCGCGFDCVTAQVEQASKIRVNRFVSSS